MDEEGKRVFKRRGQRPETHSKYKDAILACDDVSYIEYNVAQIAYMFNLNPTCLGNQLRNHFPEILERREKERRRLGKNDNRHRGARPVINKQYAEVIEYLKNNDVTLLRASELYKVPYSGLREYLLRYHKELVNKREGKREQGKGCKKVGELTGNGQLHEPSQEQKEKYEEAIHLYQTTPMTQKEIVAATGITLNGLRNYLRIWHRDLILERRGITPTEGEEAPELADTKHYLKSTAAKYADAILCLKESGKSTAEVAKEFGLHPESFRSYLHEHEPALAASMGMKTTADGKRVRARSAEKYEEAIRLYETSTEDLKSIAQRLGITYNSLGSFVRRNRPDAIIAHNKLLKD